MINAKQFFELAQLAEASYASFDSPLSLKDAVTNTNPDYNKMSFSIARTQGVSFEFLFEVPSCPVARALN